MSIAYQTDGPLYIGRGKPPVMNAMESVADAIAYDVHDWFENRRTAWIWCIVYGVDDDESWEYFVKMHNWDDEDRARARELHRQWEWADKTLWEMQKERINNGHLHCGEHA